MKKSKFTMLEESTETNQIIKNADLTEKQKKKKKKNIILYDIPVEWQTIIKESKLQSFNAYARRAIFETLQKDGLI